MLVDFVELNSFLLYFLFWTWYQLLLLFVYGMVNNSLRYPQKKRKSRPTQIHNSNSQNCIHTGWFNHFVPPIWKVIKHMVLKEKNFLWMNVLKRFVFHLSVSSCISKFLTQNRFKRRQYCNFAWLFYLELTKFKIWVKYLDLFQKSSRLKTLKLNAMKTDVEKKVNT